MIIAGLHVAFLLFHNNVVDRIADNDNQVQLVATRRQREDPDELFRRARRLTTWHYQWMILHEFLPLFIGQAMVDNILKTDESFTSPMWGSFPSSSRARRTASVTVWYDPLTERTLPAWMARLYSS